MGPRRRDEGGHHDLGILHGGDHQLGDEDCVRMARGVRAVFLSLREGQLAHEQTLRGADAEHRCRALPGELARPRRAAGLHFGHSWPAVHWQGRLCGLGARLVHGRRPVPHGEHGHKCSLHGCSEPCHAFLQQVQAMVLHQGAVLQKVRAGRAAPAVHEPRVQHVYEVRATHDDGVRHHAVLLGASLAVLRGCRLHVRDVLGGQDRAVAGLEEASPVRLADAQEGLTDPDLRRALALLRRHPHVRPAVHLPVQHFGRQVGFAHL
mmetsp:Transcript_7383/g.20444  ORF Transcript_7383/g.20444 Transcript_7383/m.20444 type:complete len:264 (+) Transcript_7383:1499-2290(+)